MEEDAGFIPFSRKRKIEEVLESDQESEEESEAVWISEATKRARHPFVKLHNEIIDFCEYVELSRLEVIQHDMAIENISLLVKKIWPEAEVKTFGSYITGLSLPDSDIDLAIILNNEKPSRTLIQKLASFLQENNAIVEQEEILTARVPLLKIIEKETGISMDLSFNVLDGYNAIEPVKALLKKYPPLRYLILVLKEFLRQRQLNETFRGGIGSFLLIVMTVAYLQFEIKENRKEFAEKTLGEFLINFLKFYGSQFNHEELGISIVGDGQFYKKDSRDSELSVENPQDIEHDIGKSARHYRDIVKAFQYASDLLRLHHASLAEILNPRKLRKIPKND